MNQSLVFNDIEVNKKDFYVSKQAILLNLVDVNNIVISKKVKTNNDTYKYLLVITMKIKSDNYILFYHK